MKFFIFLFLFFGIYLHCYAQEPFEGIYETIGKTTDEIIKGENYLIRDTSIAYDEFKSAKVLPYGGLYLLYEMTYKDNSMTDNVYYFKKDNKCFLFKSIQPIDNLGSQLAMFGKYFYKKDDHTLYDKVFNLKVVYYTDIPNKLVIFIYAHKETPVSQD